VSGALGLAWPGGVPGLLWWRIQAVCAGRHPNFTLPYPAQEVDKVELVYTKFVSLISSEPTIQTLLPLTPQARTAPRKGMGACPRHAPAGTVGSARWPARGSTKLSVVLGVHLMAWWLARSC